MSKSMPVSDLEIEEFLKPEMEGNLYEHIYIHYFGGTYHISKTHYAVLQGEVYLVHKGGKQKSRDSLLTTKTECHLLGRFDPEASYSSVNFECSSQFLNEILKTQNNETP